MIFPIGDEQVKGGHFPYVSYAFIAMNVVAFLFQLSFENALICEYGSIPNNILAGNDYITLFTSMFMHGGWMHLIGNMLFLWVFGDNIEAKIGSIPFLAFYLLGGLAAHAGHIFIGGAGEAIASCCNPCGGGMPCTEGIRACAGSIPTVGASGAIAAVLGAYLVMFPHSKVKILVLYFFRSFHIAAYWFLGFWIVQQLFSGFTTLGPEGAGSGVAWWAHIGGFVFGVIAGFFARQSYGGGLDVLPIDTLGPKKPKNNNGDFV